MSGRWEGKEVREEDIKKYLGLLNDPEAFGKFLSEAMGELRIGNFNEFDPTKFVSLSFSCTVGEAIGVLNTLSEMRGMVNRNRATKASMQEFHALMPPDYFPHQVITKEGGVICNQCGSPFNDISQFNSHSCMVDAKERQANERKQNK